MAHKTQPYNIAVIRNLLRAAFTPKDLHRFCHDHPQFRPIVANFGPKYNLNDMIDEVVIYCDTHALFDQLLADVKDINARQYARFEEYLHIPESNAYAGPTTTKAERPISSFGELARSITDALTIDTEAQRAIRNRQAMLQLVKNTWIKGVLEQSLHGAVMIELGMEERTDAVERPWDMVVQMPGQSRRQLPPGTKIIDVFDETNQSLLILGAPGSGKTTTLLELARDTIARAEQDPTQPIPVIFNLSSWSNKKQSITEWLVQELNAKYHIPQKIAYAWLENDELLLLLDGLDEVRAELRDDCVQAINGFRRVHGLTSLVVCSRAADCEVLSSKLELRGAVLLQPLTLDQIDQYLAGAEDMLPAMHKTLENDLAFREMVQSPLMLNVVLLAYPGLSIGDERVFGLTETHREHLFDIYVQQMYQRRGSERPHSPKQTASWLEWLAKKMVERNQAIFMIEQLQPDWLPVDSARWLATSGISLVVWLLGGVILGTAAGLSYDLIVGGLSVGLATGTANALAASAAVILLIKRIFGIKGGAIVGGISVLANIFSVWLFHGSLTLFAFGIAAGLGVGIAFGLGGRWVTGSDRDTVKRPNDIEVVERVRWSMRKAVMGLVAGAFIGAAFGLIVGAFIYIVSGLSTGLIVVFPLWLTWTFAGGMAFGLVSNDIETKTTPNQGIKESAQNAVRVGLTGALAGLPFLIFLGLAYDLKSGLIVGAAFGLAGSAAGAMVWGGFACLQHYALRLLLYIKGYLPWDLARFLDHAAERIFLRKVGGGYIFVHRLLQDYFASLEPTQG